jgi:hypothetical protein
VVLLNRSNHEVNMGVFWTEIGYPAHLNAKIRDIWQRCDVGHSLGGVRRGCSRAWCGDAKD